MFVVVIMAIAATRPVVAFAQAALMRVAALGNRTPAAWWLTILTFGPVLGSFITEPAAMTICALLLGRQFYALEPSRRLRYATLGLLFVNVSIGGTLTHFAAPPVLMVSAPWGWSLTYMARHFGWKACAAIVTSNALYYGVFRRELRALDTIAAVTTVDDGVQDAADPGVDHRGEPGVSRVRGDGGALSPALHRRVPVLPRLRAGHRAVSVQHGPEAAVAGRVSFLPAWSPTARCRDGGLPPCCGSLTEHPLFWSATVLTAFNDNALITYLATLVPNLIETSEVRGGGGRCHRRRADGDCQRAQPRRARRFSAGTSSTGSRRCGWPLSALVPTLVAAAWFILP